MANNLTRLSPFGQMRRFSPFGDIDEMFKNFGMMPSMMGMQEQPAIKLDVNETDTAYMVKADIPGVNKEDIKVDVDGNTITIQAEIKKEQEEKKEGQVIRSERYYGQQVRSFMLGQEVDDSKVEAKYQDGVLQLTLPKKKGAAKKQITIK